MASKEFSQKLKDLRLKAGYSQKQVYEHFNIPQSTFSSWEVGKSEPSGEMLIKLCDYYNCDMMKEFKSTSSDMVTYSELSLIEKYRALDEHGKEMVDFTLLKEWERSSALKSNVISFQPLLNAAHMRTDIPITDADIQHDEDIMDDDNF